MSGVSLAVAPQSAQKQQQASMGGLMGSLRVIELQLVAFIIAFSLSGLVPLFDMVFPAFASVYLLALSRFAFPSHGSQSATSTSEAIFHGSRLFQAYVVIGTAIGLFLPLAYVLGGFARGDEHAARSATPQLFLLAFQILTDNIIRGLSLFSPPVRALVPILYTTRRIFVIIDWINDVWFNKTLPVNAQLKEVAWFWFGRGLAMANLVYFSINLFGFLIPRFLPRAFERYFKDSGDISAKTMEGINKSAAINKSQKADKKKD